ncbi:polysaccharide biosynthesis C-terminal domain-containing protein [Empedobacter stercoris]|uniref:lipopolysaccharide biosynthesis protein n=1 Tax=Empedobacter stercoris TaxID=1628248 RepID=UPI001CE134E7|nr:polysaccharide biosynthesis C-terminal domain-containing protein [Empedobacter stercoris]MCA4782140.1 polysaccharide biosynthesis C-terminal domain-containing protein [Empedobacter stercoris]
MRDKIEQILKNKDLKKVLITLFLRIIGIITLFGITLIMTRNFPAKNVGDYDFSRTLLLLLGSITLLGTDQSILYFSGFLESKQSFYSMKKLYNKIVLFMFIMCLIVYILFNCLPITLFESDTFLFLKKGIFILFFYSLTIFNTEYLRAINYVYLSELFRNTFKYLPLLLGCVLLINFNLDYSLVDFFYFGFVILAIITTVCCFLYNKKLKLSNAQVFIISNKKLLERSTPMLFSNILIFSNLSIDIFLLKKYYSSVDIAYYSTIMKLITILSMVIISFNINISTKISEFFSLNKFEDLQLLIKNNTRIVLLLNIVITTILIFIGVPLLEFFGKGYSEAYIPLIILLFSQVISSTLCTAPVILNMIGQSKIYFVILLFSTFICLIFNAILIPYYGINGAALSFLVTNFFTYFTIYIYVKRKYKLSIYFI